MWSIFACSARVNAARSLSWSIRSSIRCQGTNNAAPIIMTTAAPNRIWHLAAKEMRSWRNRRNMRAGIVTGGRDDAARDRVLLD